MSADVNMYACEHVCVCVTYLFCCIVEQVLVIYYRV